MSSYRHSASAVQRAKNRSATGAAAYRTGTRLVDVRTGAEYDYTRRRGVASAHLIVPGAAHIDAVDRQALWAAVETKHTRGDAVPAREFVANLPHELDPVDRLALALRYALHVSDTYGVAVDIGVHLPSIKPGHDQRNHHAHFLMSACSVSYAGGVLQCGKKVEALDPIASKRRGGVPVEEAERATWARMCNEALAAAGRADVVVDHRNYERQGIEQQPQIHLGPDAFDNLLRHQADPGNVVLLSRTRQWLEIEKGNSYLRKAQRFDAEVARLEAEIIEMPPPAPRPDKPVEGPSAAVVHLRPAAPEPPPAPDTGAVLAQVARLWHAHDRADGLHDDRRDSWQILRALNRNNWQPDTPALRALLDRHPALRREWFDELTEREPEISGAERERQRAIRREAARAFMSPVPSSPPPRPAPAPEPVPTPASLPVPVRPAVRVSLDSAIADAEARLAALEERERVRAAAAEAYRRAQSALQAAQAGLWSRLRAWAGFGAAVPVREAQTAVQAAAEAAKRQGLVVNFGMVMPPAGEAAAERVALKRELAALRDERGGLVATDAETARRALAAVDQVVDLVSRANRVVPAEQRAEWPALRALAAAGSVQQLRDRLAVDPGLAIALAHDLGQRVVVIERLESQSRTDSVPAGRSVSLPDAGPEYLPDSRGSAESVVDSTRRGLIAVIEAGPARAWPGHYEAFFAGCERRGEITAGEFELVAAVLRQLPEGPHLCAELLRLVDQVQQQDEAPGQQDWPAPGA